MNEAEVGQKVTVDGKRGVITEISGKLCSVRLDDKPLKPDGSPADHEADTLGCVPLASLK